YTVTQVRSPLSAVSATLLLPNAAPTIALAKPSQSSAGTVDLAWTAADPDDVAKIELSYGTDPDGFVGTPIPGAGALSEADGPGSFSWDVSGIPSGRYFVFARISDGHDHSRYEYAPAPVLVQNAT